MIDDCPKTLLEAARYFADLDVCNEYTKSIKWPRGVITCPHCGAKGDRIGEITTRRMLRCKDCRTQFTAIVGTLFEDTRRLDAWFTTIWCEANGVEVSSIALANLLGLSQKSAWKMQTRVRAARALIHQT